MIRHSALLFIALLYSNTAFTQHEPIIGNYQNSWNVSDFTLYGYLTDSLFVTGDTIINGFDYKVVESIMVDGDGLPMLVFGPLGYLREDTVSGKAWFLNHYWPNDEFLFYDLSLAPGDSFLIPGFDGDNHVVDSVYTYNNRLHVRVDFHYMTVGTHLFNEKLTFIEGVGTNYSFLYDQNHRVDPVLLCAHKDNLPTYVQVYADTFYTGCNTFNPMGGLDENSTLDAGFTIFPNPSNGIFTLSLTKPLLSPTKFEIIDLTGRLVYATALQQANDIYSISLPELSEGIYGCRLVGETSTSIKLIVIQK